MMSNVHPNCTKSRQCQTLPEYDRATVRQGNVSSRALPEGLFHQAGKLPRGLPSFVYAVAEHHPQ